MKKISIIIFSILTLLTPVFFTNAFGSASLVASGVTENYVALNISNFPANTDVNISVYPALNSNDKSEQIITSNASGVIKTNFSVLKSNTDYVAMAEANDGLGNLYIAKANFTTLKKLIPSVDPVNNTTGISITLNVKGLPNGASFNVSISKKSDNSDVNSSDGTIGNNGFASVPITGLAPGVTYKISLKNSSGTELATNEFTSLPVTGKLSVVNSNTDITSNSIELKIDLSLSNIPYFVNIYKKGETTALDFKQGTSLGGGKDSVIFSSKIVPNTAYTTSLFVRGNEAKSLSDYTFTTNELTGATVNTYDLQSTSTSLEFHNLPVGGKFTAFIKADSDNGNTTGSYTVSDLPPTTKTENTVYAENFTGLIPGSAYVGGIVGDISVHFLTPLTDIVGVDYSILEKTILAATDLVTSAAIKEGTAVGQYPVGSKDILNTALRKTKDDYEFIKKNSETETIEAMQSRVNSDIAELQMAIDTFKAKIVGGTSNPQNPSQKPGFWSKGGGLIPECNNGPCVFNELMQLINNVIKFLLFTIATPLAALGIVYAGWLYLSSGGNTENTTKAKKILTNIVIGYIIALAAWLIVNTIIKSLGLDSSINTFPK